MAIKNTSPTRYEPIPLLRIRRVSMLLARSCLALILGLPVLVAGFWMLAEAADLGAYSRIGGLLIEQPIEMWQRLAGASITLVSLGLLLVGLGHARRCFQLFADGRYFELEVIDSLRRFAAWTCASVGASFVCMPALSVLLTINNAPGHRQLVIGLSSELVFTLFIAGMVWLIAAVMTHAHALAEENAQFV